MTANTHGAGATHGGARPAIRPDDGRRNNKHGSPGRMPKSFTLKLGDAYYAATADGEGKGVGTAELWTVAEITRTHVKFRSDTGDTIRLLR